MEWYDRMTAVGLERRLAARRMLLRTSAFLNQRLDLDLSTLSLPRPLNAKTRAKKTRKNT